MGTIFDAQGRLTEANRSIWSEIELVQDFTLVVAIYKFEEDLIKNKCAIVSTTSSQRSRARNSEVNSSNSSKIL